MSPPQQGKPDVPRSTVASAVASLTKWMRERAAEAPPSLLSDERDDLVVLQLSLRTVPAKTTVKPHLLPLPHHVMAHSAASVCIISDDRAGTGSPAASAILDAARSLKLSVEVIPFSAICTDYRPYESRRRFAASYDLFLADRALLPMLPRLLGKAFYSTKKAPIAVDFTRAGWPEQVRKVLNSTFLYLRTGTCSGIKVGRLDMEEDEIVENVMVAMEAAVEKVPKKWANVRALHLKAVDSVALPLYQVVPELGLKIEVPRQLEGGIGAGEIIDAAELETGGKQKGKKMKALKNAKGAKGESVKYKRKRKDQTEDVVMKEVQEMSEKKRKKEDVPLIEVSVDEGLNLAKKGKDKKRALDMEVEDASPAEKKGKKSEHASKEVGSKKSKGKKEDSKQAREEVEDVGSKRSKVKKEEVREGKKKKKKSVKGGCDDGEILVGEESIPDTKEEKKSKGKKSSGDKMKKRTRAKVSCC